MIAYSVFGRVGLAFAGVCVSCSGVSGQEVVESRLLFADDGVIRDFFGADVTIDGGLVAVGTPGRNSNGLQDVGVVHLFDGKTGEQQRVFSPPTPSTSNALFGAVVAMDEGLLAVLAPHGSGFSNAFDVFVYELDTGMLQTLVEVQDPNLGHSVGLEEQFMDMSDGRIAVRRYNPDIGMSGGNEVVILDASTGFVLRTIAPEDGLPPSTHFGDAIALDGDILAVGDLGNQTTLTGTVYLFDVTTGDEIARLTSGKPNSDSFGAFVALSGDLLAVSPYGVSASDAPAVAWLFDATTGELVRTFAAPTLEGSEPFGVIDVAIGDGKLVVGRASEGAIEGEAYLFDLHSGDLLGQLLPQDAEMTGQFGSAVATDDGLVVVGSVTSTTQVADGTGAVHVFEGALPCSVADDAEPFGALNFFDVSVFIKSFTAGDPLADVAADGVLNFFDISAYIQEFQVGCP